MEKKSTHFILSLKLWHFVLVGIIFSEIITFSFSKLTTDLFFDDLSDEVMKTIYVVGTVDAFFAATFVGRAYSPANPKAVVAPPILIKSRRFNLTSFFVLYFFIITTVFR